MLWQWGCWNRNKMTLLLGRHMLVSTIVFGSTRNSHVASGHPIFIFLGCGTKCKCIHTCLTRAQEMGSDPHQGWRYGPGHQRSYLHKKHCSWELCGQIRGPQSDDPIDLLLLCPSSLLGGCPHLDSTFSKWVLSQGLRHLHCTYHLSDPL